MKEKNISVARKEYIDYYQKNIGELVERFRNGELDLWKTNRSISSILEITNAEYKIDLMEFDIPTNIEVNSGWQKGLKFVAITTEGTDMFGARGIRYDSNLKNVKDGEILLSDFKKK